MSEDEDVKDSAVYCSFVSIHYIICECGDTFPTEEALKEHLEAEHPHRVEKKEFKCGLCPKEFPSEAACAGHQRRAHAPPAAPPRTYTVVPLTQHEKDKMLVVTSGLHPPAVRKKKYQNKNVKNRVCEVCGKKYASNAALRYHQRVHTGERPYQCHFCPKAFTMPLFLQIHTRTHTGERPYACALCPKAFGNKAALLRHDRVHSGAKPYACPRCGKAFSQSNSQKLHVRTVHLKLPAPYKSRRRRLQEVKQEVVEWDTIKSEDDQEVTYELDDKQQVLYEVVYEQE